MRFCTRVGLAALSLILATGGILAAEPVPATANVARATNEAAEQREILALGVDALVANIEAGDDYIQLVVKGEDMIANLNRSCVHLGAAADELPHLATRFDSLAETDKAVEFDAKVAANGCRRMAEDMARAKSACWRSLQAIQRGDAEYAGWAMVAAGEQMKSAVEWWDAASDNILYALNGGPE